MPGSGQRLCTTALRSCRTCCAFSSVPVADSAKAGSYLSVVRLERLRHRLAAEGEAALRLAGGQGDTSSTRRRHGGVYLATAQPGKAVTEELTDRVQEHHEDVTPSSRRESRHDDIPQHRPDDHKAPVLSSEPMGGLKEFIEL